MARQTARSSRLWRWALLIGLLWLGAFLRLHQLDGLPPGLYYDEAFYAQDAQHVLHDGRLAIFFTGNFGREPLHIYLLAGAMALLGERVWVLRLVTAFSGVLAIPLTYCLARALLRGHGQRAVWAAVLAAALLAVSYWHVNFSRVMFRAIHLVPLSVLALWLLWRGARKDSTRLYVLSGVALGLSQYTYLAARLLPVVVAGLAGVQAVQGWLFGRQALRAALRRPLVRGSVIALLTAALVFAPLGAYYALHPEQLSGRSGGLSIFNPRPAMPDPTAAPPTLASNLLAVTRMFVDHGDVHPRHNLPGRAAADVVGLVGFWIGLAAALIGLRRPQHQLLLLWLGSMLLPTLLSIEAPHFLRAIGALGPLCVLGGVGLARVGQLVARPWPAAWPALIAGAALIGGGLTYRDYFVHWPLEPRLADEFEAARYSLAQEALRLSATTDVALPFELYTHPTVLFVLEPTFPHLTPIEDAAPGQRPLVVLAPPGAEVRSLVVLRRAPGQPGLALVTSPLSAEAAEALSAKPPARTLQDAYGRTVGMVTAEVEALLPASAQAEQPLDVTFDNTLRLEGYQLRGALNAGEQLEVDLRWQSLRWAPQDYVSFLQLQSAAGDNLAQRDAQPGRGWYLTTLWRPGNTVTDYYTLTVPSGLAPGKYRLVYGLYEPGTIARVPAQGPGGPFDALTLTILGVTDPLLDASVIPNRQSVTAGAPPLFALTGYEVGPAAPGSDLTVTLYWEALAPIAEDYNIFVHFEDAQGTLLAQQDGPPLDGRAPTSWWAPGEVFRDVHRLVVPSGLAPGDYTLAVGAYHWATGERVPLFSDTGERLPDDRWLAPEPLVVAP